MFNETDNLVNSMSVAGGVQYTPEYKAINKYFKRYTFKKRKELTREMKESSKEGKKRKGKDGNMWVVRKIKNGSLRWMKVKSNNKYIKQFNSNIMEHWEHLLG